MKIDRPTTHWQPTMDDEISLLSLSSLPSLFVQRIITILVLFIVSSFCTTTTTTTVTALILLPTTTTTTKTKTTTAGRPPFILKYPPNYSTTGTTTTMLHASISSDETQSSYTEQQQQQYSSSSSSSNNNNNNNNNNNPKKVTLYEILGASPTATRMELKKKYVTLAKMTHPDAAKQQQQQQQANVGNTDENNNINETTVYDFNDIATAYKILSDDKQRRRYDRSIQAEVLTEQIAMAVQNHPITELTIKAIGTIAVPFFRTMNNNNNNKKVTTTKSSPPTTSTTTMTNKPRQQQELLEIKAQNEYDRLVQIRENLQTVTQERIRRSMYTSQSGLNSNEAYILLNSFPTTTTTTTSSSNAGNGGTGASWVERLNFLRSSVETEIHTLQNSEQAFIQQQQINTRAQAIHQSTMHDQFMIRQNFIAAERAEQEARRMYERATEETRQQRYQYERISEELFAAENAAVYASNELERMQHIIQKQSEQVRQALVRKERVLINNQHHHHHSNNNNNDEMGHNNKPEPPMSPLFTASSFSTSNSRPSYSTLSEPSSSSSFIESSESSMLNAWSNQPSMSTSTTFTTHPQSSTNPPNMSVMGFDTSDHDNHHHNTNDDMDELMRLRQQEYEMTIMIHEIEAHIHHLMEQMPHPK